MYTVRILAQRVDADSTLNHPRLILRYLENAVYL